MPTVVISAYNVASFPEGGGHFWVYLQYALGLRQLGCDVYWLEGFRSKGRPERENAALAAFRTRTAAFGLANKLILYVTHGLEPAAELPDEYLAMSREEAEAVYDRADLVLNFHYAISPALLARFRRTALVDIDPGLLQFWTQRGQLKVPRHDLYFTTGETVGRKESRIPDCGLPWIRIRPAVLPGALAQRLRSRRGSLHHRFDLGFVGLDRGRGGDLREHQTRRVPGVCRSSAPDQAAA